MKIILALIFFISASLALGDELIRMPARQEAFWAGYKKVDLTNKINRAPTELIDYLRKDNERQGWKNQPRAFDLSDEFKSDVRSALLELPLNLRQKISALAVGIFIVEDLGGSAYTDYVVDQSGKPVAGFVVLDRSMLNRNANDWATWKESSPFALDSSVTLRGTIESHQNDNRKNALQYILLHEFGHILSIQSPLLPLWGSDWKNNRVKPEMSFFHQSWKIVAGNLVSLYDIKWPERSSIRYYPEVSKKLPTRTAIDSYRMITTTNFPTLYAATNPFDDFADSFANFVHVVILKKPWQIEITSGPTKIVIKSCWDEQRCSSKKSLLESVFK